MDQTARVYTQNGPPATAEDPLVIVVRQEGIEPPKHATSDAALPPRSAAKKDP